MKNIFQNAYFHLSAANVKQLPKDEGCEIAIVGRSNAGKSSVLNTLTQKKQLARVSKTPGRTQCLNVFIVSENSRMIDLPGYGYAAVSPSVQRSWQQLIENYFHSRKSLRALILVMDIRHPVRETDQLLLEYCVSRSLAVHVLLNKADKLSKQQALKTEREVSQFLKKYDTSIGLQIFSATKGVGREQLQQVIADWYTGKS